MSNSVYKWPTYGVLLIAYVLFKYALTSHHIILTMPDSKGYMEVPSWRPFTVPFVYHLLKWTPAVVDFQWFFSCCVWLFLAFTMIWLIRPWVIGLITGLAFLVLSLSHSILQWDFAILSESLSISFFVALAAALLIYYHLISQKQWKASLIFFLIPVLPLLILFSNTRDSNLYLLLLITPLLLVLMARGGGGKAMWAQMALVLVAFITVYLAQQHQANLNERWKAPLEHVIFTRVLTTPDELQFFEKKGLPVTPEVLKKAGDPKAGLSGQEKQDFDQWINQKGKTTYMLYMISHPIETGHMVLTQFQHAFNAGAIERYYGNVHLDPVSHQINRVIFFTIGHPLRWLLVLLLLPFLSLAITRHYWRVAVLHLAVLLAAASQTYIGYMGDAIETVRHCLLGDILFRVSLITASLVIFYTIYARVTPKGRKINHGDL